VEKEWPDQSKEVLAWYVEQAFERLHGIGFLSEKPEKRSGVEYFWGLFVRYGLQLDFYLRLQ
jgi:hypothetical protein